MPRESGETRKIRQIHRSSKIPELAHRKTRQTNFFQLEGRIMAARKWTEAQTTHQAAPHLAPTTTRWRSGPHLAGDG